MDVVLIPAYRRPEFLWLCLENIKKAKNHNNDKLYIINLDYGYNPENFEVIEQFTPLFNHIQINLTPNVYLPPSKQSYAVLEGYRLAHQLSSNFVYMVEEDVMVGDHFFDWHVAIHQREPDIYCSIATRNNNTRRQPMGDYSKYYLQKGDYQSLGVCFRKERLEPILAHANYNYYTNPIEYCRKTWPESILNPAFVEQDGLHRRVMGDLPVAFSYDGFAYHAGFFGYNRPNKRVRGATLADKVQLTRNIIGDPERIAQKITDVGLDPYDSTPISLVQNWNGQLDRI